MSAEPKYEENRLPPQKTVRDYSVDGRETAGVTKTFVCAGNTRGMLFTPVGGSSFFG